MEHLAVKIESIIAHVESLPPSPTDEQLRAKVRRISDDLSAFTTSMAKAAQDIVASGLAVAGWDVRTRTVKDLQSFTLPNLLSGLRQMLRSIAALQSDQPPLAPPTADELADISLACTRLWALDVNRLVPDKDYRINVQRGKKMWDEGDVASEPLFSYVDPAALRKPTYAAFIALLDNYSAVLGTTEVVDAVERAENKRFIDLVMQTQVMQYVFQYLQRAGKIRSSNRDQFAREVHDLWFGLYSRVRTNDSSGFEHVFLGEIKADKNEIVGLHNWIQIHLQEKAKTFDYQGFIKPKRPALPSRIPQDHLQLISLQFKWHGALKKVSSSFIGTSPEFELALYTLFFYMGIENAVVETGPYRVQVELHKWRQGGKEYVATSFPSEAPLTEDEAATRIQSQARARTTRNSGRGR